jgi:hypothetical protein
MTSIVEREYQARIAALSPRERLERSAAMLKWTRALLARQVIAELGPMSTERLKWEVAKRLYRGDPAAQALIARRLADVSG